MGGGHAHVAVLRSFGMRPLPGVRITLVTPSPHTAYRYACMHISELLASQAALLTLSAY